MSKQQDTTPRYVQVGAIVHDSELARYAPFNSGAEAVEAARLMNDRESSAAQYEWTVTA